MKVIIQVTSSFFLACVWVINGIITKADPELQYMLGWTVENVRDHCKEKQWEFICV